ncbi:MAG: sulfatase-like hydrolase/transferase [Bacteroidota bacterium]
MERRNFIKILGSGSFYLAGGRLIQSCNGSAKQKPNIILCMADDQGWGDMGYYDHPHLKTPNCDAMAASALRFDRFYAAAPVSTPTRGSVLTGRHPNRFGAFKWGHTLRPQEITIAEALKTAGYVTGHFGKWHLGSVLKGSPVNPGASGFDEWLSAPNFFDNNPILSREGKAVQTEGESSKVTVDAAIDFIREHTDSSDPFLAVVWFGSPHTPHKATEINRKPYAQLSEDKQDFYGEITGMDRAVGKLRRELRSLGIEKNTLLWYCSDNGGLDPNTSGGRGKKGEIYEGGLRVPAILEWPDHISQSRVSDVPCNTSDIYPTILDLVGIRMADQPPLDGISLVPIIDQKMNSRPSPIGFWEHPTRGRGIPSAEWMSQLLEAQKSGKELPEKQARLRRDAGKITRQYPLDSFPGHAAWLDWPWKLHRIQPEENGLTLELYDLSEDPDEKHNIADDNPDQVRNMKQQLETWLKSVVRSLNGEDYE